MRAAVLEEIGPLEKTPLKIKNVPDPEVGPGQVKINVDACGVCHTDLHVVEGDLDPPDLPLIPGHQVVGRVESVGEGVEKFDVGDRVGLPWLYSTCGECEFCRKGLENLCETAKFTGYDADGGFAEKVLTEADFTYSVPEGRAAAELAPLLCGGVIGYRAYRLSEVERGGNLGLYGFGSSAHMVMQIALHRNDEVYVFTRSQHHRDLAREMGARWVGGAGDNPPEKMDASIIFAPAGWIVPEALRVLEKGGTVATAGIHMSPIPEFDYDLLYGERSITSVANSTRQDVRELLNLGNEIPIETEVEVYPFEDVNQVLGKLKRSEIKASAVLRF